MVSGLYIWWRVMRKVSISADIVRLQLRGKLEENGTEFSCRRTRRTHAFTCETRVGTQQGGRSCVRYSVGDAILFLYEFQVTDIADAPVFKSLCSLTRICFQEYPEKS